MKTAPFFRLLVGEMAEFPVILIDVRRFNIDVHVLARIKLEQAPKLTPLFKGDESERSQDHLVVNVFQRLFQTSLPLLSFNF